MTSSDLRSKSRDSSEIICDRNIQVENEISPNNAQDLKREIENEKLLPKKAWNQAGLDEKRHDS